MGATENRVNKIPWSPPFLATIMKAMEFAAVAEIAYRIYVSGRVTLLVVDKLVVHWATVMVDIWFSRRLNEWICITLICVQCFCKSNILLNPK